LGGGAIFVETWCWVAIGGLIAFFAPNTQEIMGRFKPALPEEGRAKLRPAPHLSWTPQRRNAIATGLLFALGMLALSRPTEFLYFQF
jgi:alginate O-acetyltransferase complex protein AlgI